MALESESCDSLESFCRCNPDAPECLTLWKSHDASDDERKIEGLASLDIRDQQGEIVHPDKLDFEYLKKSGTINWHHGQDPGDNIGYVTDYEVGPVRDIVPKRFHDRVRKHLDRIGLYVRGRLKKGLKKANDAWLDMTSNPDDHGLGFSVHGSARREGIHVVAGKVTAIALTHMPVLTETFATLAKALGGGYARSNQTGAPAMIKEDLRPGMISTTFGSLSKYGANPDGGIIGVKETEVGSGKRVKRDDSIKQETTKRSVAMPAGRAVENQFVDAPAAAHALRAFLRYVRERGPQRGSVLDGSRDYFSTIHGLDSRTATALSKYVREHADELFRKAFVGDQSMDHIAELEKALTEVTIDGGSPLVKAETVPTPPPTPTAPATPVAPAVPAEPPAEPLVKDMGGEAACKSCGYNKLAKGCSTCPVCGEALKKAIVDDPDGEDLLDVTEVMGNLEKSVTGSARGTEALVKANVHLIRSHAAMAKSNGELTVLVKALTTSNADMRKELAESRTEGAALMKSLDDVRERIGLIAATPKTRQSAPPGATQLAKSVTGTDPATAAETPLNDVERAQFTAYLRKGFVTPDLGVKLDTGRISLRKAFEQAKAAAAVEEAAGDNGARANFRLGV